MISNGFVCEEPFSDLLQYLDALNIDLKAFNETLYKNLSGDLEFVKRSIELAAHKTHIEITTLVVPGKNDSEEEIRELSKRIASIRTDIPLHLTRFFPRYKMTAKKATTVESICRLTDIARKYLLYVHEGNC